MFFLFRSLPPSSRLSLGQGYQRNLLKVPRLVTHSLIHSLKESQHQPSCVRKDVIFSPQIQGRTQIPDTHHNSSNRGCPVGQITLPAGKYGDMKSRRTPQNQSMNLFCENSSKKVLLPLMCVRWHSVPTKHLQHQTVKIATMAGKNLGSEPEGMQTLGLGTPALIATSTRDCTNESLPPPPRQFMSDMSIQDRVPR